MDSTLSCLAAWMPRQRWYSAKGRAPSLRLIASWEVPTPADLEEHDQRARVRTLLVADEGALPVVLYHVPVVARETATVDIDADHVIGSPEPGTTLIDGPFDPAYARALLRMVAAGTPGVALDTPSRVLTGEQSNTSLVYRGESGDTPIICKLYRQLHSGLNPDIELQTALAEAGSPYVPHAVGSVAGRWPDPSDPARRTGGSLAFAQEFLPGVEDAWRVALRAASSGEDFTDRARDLGVATAAVHVSLAELFDTRPTDDADREATATSWRRRLAIAIAEVPTIADSRQAIESVYARAVLGPWPHLQRIHGDYHLGQVILVPGRGWMLLDFEGEPIRPMVERVRPDFALRDVAGMLRSFDYVAGSIRLDQPDRSPESVRAWALEARRAFLDGYRVASGVDLDASRALLDALELDKAVYEAIYESRNRPTWVTIPLRAITRLVARQERL